MKPKNEIVFNVKLADLFDAEGRLRPVQELPEATIGAIATFDILRTTIQTAGETITTEELIRVKLRDGRRAEVSRRAGSASRRVLRQQPLRPRRLTFAERSIGRGQTAAAEAASCEREVE